MIQDELKKQVIALAIKSLNQGAQVIHERTLLDKDGAETQLLIRKMRGAALHLALLFDQGDLK